jgi:hypothetical protein
MTVTAYSELVAFANSSLSMPLASPAIQVMVITPLNSLGKPDTIGPARNTCPWRASYDSLTDYNTGGLPDSRVRISSPDSGKYTMVYTLIGNLGTRLTGVGIDAHAEIMKRLTFAEGTLLDASLALRQIVDSFYLAPPARGELTGDGVIDVFDVIASIDIIFSGAPPPSPPELVDVNCDGVPDVFDVIYLIDYAFSGGQQPCQ